MKGHRVKVECKNGLNCLRTALEVVRIIFLMYQNYIKASKDCKTMSFFPQEMCALKRHMLDQYWTSERKHLEQKTDFTSIQGLLHDTIKANYLFFYAIFFPKRHSNKILYLLFT